MVRTVEQIEGDLGLTQNADTDPFASVEENILENVEKIAKETRSVSEELNAAKGVSRSTFTAGVQAQEEAAILGAGVAEVANIRGQDAFAQQEFERGLIGEQFTADIAAETAVTAQESQIALVEKQAAEEETLRQADFEREVGVFNQETGVFEGGSLQAQVAAEEITAAAAQTRAIELIEANTTAQITSLVKQQEIEAVELFGPDAVLRDPQGNVLKNPDGSLQLNPSILEKDAEGNFVNANGALMAEFTLNSKLQQEKLTVQAAIELEQQQTQLLIATLSAGLSLVTPEGVGDFVASIGDLIFGNENKDASGGTDINDLLNLIA